jgi:hypothetical protein
MVVVWKLTVKVAFNGKDRKKNATSPGSWFHHVLYSKADIVCNGNHGYPEGNNDI